MNISEMLKRNARMYPGKSALIERRQDPFSRREISWHDLDGRVNRVANALMALGVTRGDRVLIWMMNSLSWLESYLGILRTGAWAAPLNHRFTSREFKYCMDIAEPRAIICGEDFLVRVEAAGQLACPRENVVVVGSETPAGMINFEETLAPSSDAEVNVGIGDEDPCGLYFTSGTTGDPKPILLTHKNLECSAITEVVHGLRRAGDLFIILKPLYHTGDMMHWLSSLIIGEPAVIQCGVITPRVIFDVVQEERGTVAMLLVPWVQDILTALEQGKLRKEDWDLSSWRLVMYGAQPVPPALVRRWRDMFPHMAFEINYGQTESTGPGCIHLSMADERKLGSIGLPGFNWEACIVNEEGKRLSPGDVGEIAVKGNGVMKEYYRNPGKTDQTLRNGWLHTGDMGRMDRDGFIWLVDRKNDVIFYGGENIYPAEIEEVLQGHPAIHDVAVIGIADARLGETVAAVVEPETGLPGMDELRQDIISFCEANLPKYKRPRRIIFDKVPRNPTGKIEKVKLKQKYD